MADTKSAGEAKISWRDVPLTSRDGPATPAQRVKAMRTYRDGGFMHDFFPVSQAEFDACEELEDLDDLEGPSPKEIDFSGLDEAEG